MLTYTRYALEMGSIEDLKRLLNKARQQPVEAEFERKLAYRMLYTHYATEKLSTCLRLLMSFAVNDTINATIDDTIDDTMNDGEISTWQALKASLEVLKTCFLPTVDVREWIVKQLPGLIDWLFIVMADCISNMNIEDARLSLEMAAKSTTDILLMAHQSVFHRLVPATAQLGLALAHSNSPAVIDPIIRVLSIVYEFASDSDTARLDSSPFWDQLLIRAMGTSSSDPSSSLSAEVDREEMQVPLLQGMATHFITRLPTRLKSTCLALCRDIERANLIYLHHNNNNQQNNVPQHLQQRRATLANMAGRIGHILTSPPTALGIRILHAEQYAHRFSSLIPSNSSSTSSRSILRIHRHCESCQATEPHFGQFMVCAGCRRVRYCSKECQGRDWKYHRMGCMFFRPRPGFRTRGTQARVDRGTQTGDADTSNAIDGAVEGGDGMDVDEGLVIRGVRTGQKRPPSMSSMGGGTTANSGSLAVRRSFHHSNSNSTSDLLAASSDASATPTAAAAGSNQSPEQVPSNTNNGSNGVPEGKKVMRDVHVQTDITWVDDRDRRRGAARWIVYVDVGTQTDIIV